MRHENGPIYRDRQQAGERLAAVLAERAFTRPIVLGIPRGGVAVSVEIAQRLDAEHGVVVARKLGAPHQPDLAIGATTASGISYINQRIADEVGADAAYVTAETGRQTSTARRYEETFNSHRRPPIEGRDVIVVDDGVATGATAIAAVRSLKAAGAQRVIFAVPVGPPHTIEQLRHEADEVVCLVTDSSLFAVGQYYSDFDQVDDEMVRTLLDRLTGHRSASATA